MDKERISKDIDVCPGCFYHSCRWVLFGKKEPLPVPPSMILGKAKGNNLKKTSPDEMFQNHCLHFSFLCPQIAVDAVKNQITLIDPKMKKI